MVFEGAGILKALTDDNEDSIIEMVSKGKTVQRLCKLLSDYISNESMIDRVIITCGNICTSNQPQVV